MAAPRKHPPANAVETIEELASKGYSTIGLAKHFNVARSVIMRWFKAENGQDNKFEEAYQRGRDSYRQSIEQQIVAMGLAGKNPAGLIYILKACFKMYDVPQSGTKVDVAVNNQAPPIMIVTDHGTDEQWAAKCAEQQQRLTQDSGAKTLQGGSVSASQPSLEASVAASINEAPAAFQSAPQGIPVWKDRG